MRRYLAYSVAILLIAGAASAVFMAAGSKSNSDKKSTLSNTQSTPLKTLATKKACEVFTLTDAKELLGDTAKGGQNPVVESSEDVSVSTCTYTQDQGANAPVTSRKSATLLARSPKTDPGATTNRNEFGPLRPTTVQDVSGYGDSAYWDAQHGQLNILKNGSWYILSYGPVSPTDRSLDDVRQMADILINKM